MSRKLLPALITAVVALVMAACSYGPGASPAGGPSAAPGEPVTIKIGTTEGAQPYWNTIVELGKAEGLDIQVTNFTDYTKANPAVSSGELDLNAFQHLQFLAQYNVEASDDLTPIGATYVVPLNLYSEKHTSVDQIPAGGKIAVPNDPSNLARALLVLQQAGLVELRDGGNSLSGESDVLPSSKVKIQAVDASQTVVGLGTVDGAIINNNFLADAGIDPNSAIVKDDPNAESTKPYVNVIVSRAADKDNPAFAKVVDIYHRPEVEKQRLEATGGTGVSRSDSPDQLQATLTEIENNLKNKG